MRKLVILAAVAATAVVAALAVPTAGAQSSPAFTLRTALGTCQAERRADPAEFRRQYGVGFWRFSPLLRCVVVKLTATPTPPAPPPPPPPGEGF